MSGFNPFGSWEDFVSTVNLKGFAWKNLIGQDRAELWTPGLAFGGASTGITGDFSGRYIKVGRLLVAHFYINLSSKGSATGVATLTGLPLAVPGGTFVWVGNVIWSGMSTALVHASCLPIQATTTASLHGLAAANVTSSQSLADTDFGNSSGIFGTLIYQTNK